MRYIFVFLCGMLWVNSVVAKPNVFCKNEDSLDDYCMAAANVTYEGYMKSFTGSVKKHQKNEELTDKQIWEEAQELIPYSIFHSAFQFCGETEKNMRKAQVCLVKELQKYVVVKVKEQQQMLEQQQAENEQ